MSKLLTVGEMGLDSEDLGPLGDDPAGNPAVGTTIDPNDPTWPRAKDGYIILAWDPDDQRYYLEINVYEVPANYMEEDYGSWTYYRNPQTYEEGLAILRDLASVEVFTSVHTAGFTTLD